MSELLAQDRGRASDHALNALCRRYASYQLGCGLRWRRRRVDTKENPSDEDSRLADRGALRPGEVLWPRRLVAPKPPPEPPPGLASPPAPTTYSLFEFTPGDGSCCAGARVPGDLLWVRPPDGGRYPLVPPRCAASWRRAGISACPTASSRASSPAGSSAGAYGYVVHFGTPCSRWSRARTTGCTGGAVDAKGMESAQATIRFMRLCRKHAVKISIENPAGSGLWTSSTRG